MFQISNVYSLLQGSDIKSENMNKSINGRIYFDNNSMDEISANLADVHDIEEEISKVLKDIDEVDMFIRQLNDRRINLVKKYELLKEEKVVRKSSHLAEKDWESDSFPWASDVTNAMENIFKITSLRPMQLKTINAILSKNDVLLLAPTGGGKSLCFQLPAVIQKGISIVISPLISLMEDQVWALKKLDIKVEMLTSTTDKAQLSYILRLLADKSENCDLKLLYVTPERIKKSKRFMSALQKSYFSKKLDMIAIDEVHCCSQWGHDFRPDYKFLGSLKTMFPDVPILGVTATATTKVIVDIQKMLNIRESLVLKAPFNRPNLYYHVIEKPAEKEEVIKLLAKLLKKRYTGQSGIIYTFSIKDAEDLSAELIKRGNSVRPYHASMDSERRSKIHTKWLNGEIQAVVATVAFGMGIDKPDVRFVIHHTLSKSMENFYQESGRAGRDGKPAECLLLYRFGDTSKITGMMFSENTGLKNAYSMIQYCINGTNCRRDLISKHFTEVWKDSDCNKMCDRCFFKDKVIPPPLDVTKYCLDLYKIIDHADEMDSKLTGIKLIDSWYQKGAANLRVPGVSQPNIERYYAEQIVAYLLTEDYLKEDFHFTAYSTISYIKRGGKKPLKNSEINFNGARVLGLPELSSLSKHCAMSSTSNCTNVSLDSDNCSNVSKKELNKNGITSSPSSSKLNRKRLSSSGSSGKSKSRKTRESSKLSDSWRNSLPKETIERISSNVSRIVTELVTNTTNHNRIFENDSSESDMEDVILIKSDDEVISIDD